jgi:cobyrinic acid a,c-diamide synthase
MQIPRLVLGGVSSGVGKTTITAGLVAALKGRNLSVQPFKCGPDYIDPGFLALAAGLPCHNLDSWMLTPEAMVELFLHSSRQRDIAIVEGVMGLYDGRDGPQGVGSTAEIAKWLRAPVVLLIDAGKMSQSAAALVLGYRQLDPTVNIVGVIANKVGSPNHLRLITEAVEKRADLPLLGYLPNKTNLVLPERHLGLVPSAERPEPDDFLAQLVRQIEETVDIDRLLELARASVPLKLPGASRLFPKGKPARRTKIAVARDEAFNFYYQHNLDLLAAWGAELKFFSPLRDSSLPAGVKGAYIGGGFPEIFAAELAVNTALKDNLARLANDGRPIYAECGGLMYLSQGIIDFEERRFPMVGLVPGWSKMQKKRQRLGYTTAEAVQDSIIATSGQKLRGHVFHWSNLPEPATGQAAYRILEPAAQLEGFIAGPKANVLASYLHLHFGSEPSLARRFIESCSLTDRPFPPPSHVGG